MGLEDISNSEDDHFAQQVAGGRLASGKVPTGNLDSANGVEVNMGGSLGTKLKVSSFL